MGKEDLFDHGGLDDDIFQPDFEYEDDDALISDILQSILPGEEGSADREDPEDAAEPDALPYDEDTYQDLGEYRSFDGSREYHSFDPSLPDASPEQWYRYSEEDRELDEPDELYDDYEEEPESREKRRHPVLSAIAHALLVFCTVFSIFYLITIYSDLPVISEMRTMYIRTAMSTLNHKWMATAIIPSELIDDVLRERYETEDQMAGLTSSWGNITVQALPSFSSETVESSSTAADENSQTEEAVEEADAPNLGIYESPEQQTFFELFWELDYDSVMAYMEEHPEALENGWSGIDVNESGLDDDGTSMKTIYGDQVLAVNAVDGITLIRVNLSNSRGVMAICKDTSRLTMCAATTLGVVGQTAGVICDNNSGVLSFTANGFDDPEGVGNGGSMNGLAVCSGVQYGTRLYEMEYGAKRLELRDDDKMYIVDSSSSVGEGTRDACEFLPALIIDGEVLAQDYWTSPNPRTALGQTDKLESIAVVVEGRFTDSLGCGTEVVAEKMAQYGCVQAMNLDGGTSAIMYYKGEYVTRCCNTATPSGRPLPVAWVYHTSE